MLRLYLKNIINIKCEMSDKAIWTEIINLKIYVTQARYNVANGF